MSLEKKIDDLFELRRIPDLLSLGAVSKREQKLVLIRLKRLQQVIYELDHYLETHWIINVKELQKHWQSIYDALKGLHVKIPLLEPQINHIRKYQEHELNLRSHKLPSSLDMRYFYYFKSCDVRLMRSILYHKLPTLKKYSSLSDWDQYDLVTEVHDDIEDLYEDLYAINANRFMIHLHIDGLEHTRSVYSTFLEDVESESQQVNKTSSIQDKIVSWTKESVADCRELLDRQLSVYISSPKTTPLLMSYYKEQSLA